MVIGPGGEDYVATWYGNRRDIWVRFLLLACVKGKILNLIKGMGGEWAHGPPEPTNLGGLLL